MRETERIVVVQDIMDQLIDFMLNYRQSGHPGGSRAKVPIILGLTFSGEFIFDIKNPEDVRGDRFVLSAGHTVPFIYAYLAVIAEAFRIKYRKTKNEIYYIPDEKIVLPEDLLNFRRINGLPGHAEFTGKTLFLKFNTGPSGHGLPASLGIAFALRRAGMKNVRVWVIEGDKALTTGVTHESLNAAYSLGLDNLFFLIDWNDYGIDPPPLSETVYGTPKDWFESHGWRVIGVDEGENYKKIIKAIKDIAKGEENKPNCIYFRERKGRGYLLYDYKSHGSPHKINSEIFWQTKRHFEEKYGVKFVGEVGKVPEDIRKEFWENIKITFSVLEKYDEVVDYVVDTLLKAKEKMEKREVKKISSIPIDDEELFNPEKYPKEVFFSPGSKIANRNALKIWGSYINAICKKKYGRPLFLAVSADLSDSTNISGFAYDFNEELKGFGWYHREKNREGVLLPLGITEMCNAGISAGVVSVNFALDPYKEFNGFYMATSTYGAFIYLKYGPYRLFSQMEQDAILKMGKILWVAGHSGPETADDSRTHFGIFSPAISSLFPEGKICNLHPWEANEVPVLLAEAFKRDFPIICLHLTRPSIEIPDRDKLNIPSHFEARRGAYVIRDFKDPLDKDGTVIVRGTMSTYNLLKILPEVDKRFNLKIVIATSKELFELQDDDYKNKVLPEKDFHDSMVITNESKISTLSWIANSISKEYSLSSDKDNRWRTGGTIDEILEEAQLDPESILKGIEKFVKDKKKRRERLRIG
ncbi:MAG: transketolase [Caldiserica bacterium]|nr:MAG: transketolase [Caldisericota bacterium]